MLGKTRREGDQGPGKENLTGGTEQVNSDVWGVLLGTEDNVFEAQEGVRKVQGLPRGQ